MWPAFFAPTLQTLVDSGRTIGHPSATLPRMATKQQQLEACENAILVILTGGVAEYSEAGKDYKNLSLTELREMRDDLERSIAEETGTYATFRPVVRGD